MRAYGSWRHHSTKRYEKPGKPSCPGRRISDKDPALSPLQRLEPRLAQGLGEDPDQSLKIETIELVVVAPW
jgi:hypothetical protein